MLRPVSTGQRTISNQILPHSSKPMDLNGRVISNQILPKSSMPLNLNKVPMKLKKFVRPPVPRNVWLSRIADVVTPSDLRRVEGVTPGFSRLYPPPWPPD